MMRTTATASRPRNDDTVTQKWIDHSHAMRVKTDVVVTEALRRKYPNLHLVTVPVQVAPLLSWAQITGDASFTPIADDEPTHAPMYERIWVPSRSRDGKGGLVNVLQYGKFMFKWKKHEFILYVVDGRDGSGSYPQENMNKILYTNEHAIDELIMECASWSQRLHNAIWVFDQGFWSQNADLYQEIQKAHWDDVILDADMKKSIRYDINDFYESSDKYKKLRVPWKRGLIFHGPPGNGKTVSIKATMHELQKRDPVVPTLYVRSLKSIFRKARMEAPCFLVFEDLDSIVSDDVRSYFLNEVDGLKANDGVLMVGSTNHLDQLDPGLSKRPSRFDRKYFFPDPNLEQRTQYAQYWQTKLSDNNEIAFPDKLCPAVASITDGFSFAYIQEAFVAALLSMARRDDDGDADGVLVSSSAADPDAASDLEGERTDYAGLTQAAAAEEYVKIMASLREKKKVYEQLLARLEGATDTKDEDDDGPELDDIPLWCELKKQVAILREGMDDAGRALGQGFSARVKTMPHQAGDGRSAYVKTDPNIVEALKERAENEGWNGLVVLDH